MVGPVDQSPPHRREDLTYHRGYIARHFMMYMIRNLETSRRVKSFMVGRWWAFSHATYSSKIFIKIGTKNRGKVWCNKQYENGQSFIQTIHNFKLFLIMMTSTVLVKVPPYKFLAVMRFLFVLQLKSNSDRLSGIEKNLTTVYPTK